MTCSVNYSGNWAPVMKWQQDGGPVITVGVVDNTVPNKSVSSTLRAAHAKVSKFSCTTYFNEDNNPNNINATNVPDYNFTWIWQNAEVNTDKEPDKMNVAYGKYGAISRFFSKVILLQYYYYY